MPYVHPGDRPLQHWLLYGYTGARKTVAAAGWPKPMLVYMFDPFGKDGPYLSQGKAGGLFMDNGTPCQYVMGAQGEVLINIVYLFDVNPARPATRDKPMAYERFQAYFDSVPHEEFATVVVDSTSSFRECVYNLHKYKLNPKFDGRSWHMNAGDAIRNDLMNTLSYMMTNTVMIAHVQHQVEGATEKVLKEFSAPGQLKTILGSKAGEVYFVHAKDKQGGGTESFFQTEANESFMAQTHIFAPNHCSARYEALWSNYRGTAY